MCKAAITKVSIYGEVEVEFDQEMMEYSLDNYNSDTLQIYVQPYRDWHEHKKSYDISQLNLTWTVKSFKSKKMEILLEFDHPEEVSPEIAPDSLIIDILDSNYFYSNALHKSLSEDYLRLEHEIPK